MKPKIISSAIKFCLKSDPDFPIIMTGKRHSNILHQMYLLRLDYDRTTAIQGFLADNDRFYDRYEAKELVLQNGQLIQETGYSELYSEDIWSE